MQILFNLFRIHIWEGRAPASPQYSGCRSAPPSQNLGLLCFALFLTACNQNTSQPTAATKTYTAKGVIKELEPDGKTAVIKHEAIPGYMEAMTMPFEVRDTNLLRGLKPGDSVSFKLAVTAKEGWISDLTKLESSTNPAASPATNQPEMHVTRALEPLDPGDKLPDYHFTNELGEAVSLSQFKGKVLAFTFFFTSCPFPEFCPRMTSNFAEAERQLETMTNAPAHWQLLSISFDPVHDTPAKLSHYASAADYDKNHWSFLTGEEDQIGGLAEQMGENYWHEGASIGHNLRTVVVDASGHIRKIIGGSKWTVSELVQAMVEAEH
jgi:protein SCO1/2